MLSHCYEVLKDEEKWKKRDGIEVGKNFPSALAVNVDDEEGSSDGAKRRSPTPNSVAYSMPKRPMGGKQSKEKKKKGGEDDNAHKV